MNNGHKHLRIVLGGLAMMLAAPSGAAKAPMTFGAWMDVYADVSMLKEHPELFDSVSLGMYGMRKDGSLERSKRVPDRSEVITWAHAHGVKVFITLGCNPKDAPACFTGKPLERSLRELVALCEQYGFDGVDWNTADDTSEDILARMTEKADGIPSLAESVRQFGGTPVWREPEGELSFSYTRDGQRHEVWVADPKTFEWMVDAVQKAGAAGVYAYQLEYADPGFVTVLRRKVLGKGQ